MKLYQPEHIYLHPEARDFPLTQKILTSFSQIPVTETCSAKEIAKSLNQKSDPIGAGKRALFLTRDKGRSFKPFPESDDYLSCDYYTLHLMEGCDMECSYCVLQSYLTNPALTVHVNVEEILESLQEILNQNPNRFFRIGTGQLTDSLSFDHITHFSEVLVPFFAKQNNAVLELKTKSTNIEKLLKLNANLRTIISWSLNTREIQKNEEHKTTSISDRLEAAKKIASTNEYRLGFHFDPIIDYDGWEKEYPEVIKELGCSVSEEKIAWISLGCLRLAPDLKKIVADRFPKSSLPEAEWIKSMDGKWRYFKPRRIEIYKTMVQSIRAIYPNVTLYLSMESSEVWSQVFGGAHNKASICALIDRSVAKV